MADPRMEKAVAAKVAGGVTTKTRLTLLAHPEATARLRARGNDYDPQTGQSSSKNTQAQTIKGLMNPGKMVR